MIESSSFEDIGNPSIITSSTIQNPSTSQVVQTKSCVNYAGRTSEESKRKREAKEQRSLKQYENKYKYLSMDKIPGSKMRNADRYLNDERETNQDNPSESLLPWLKLVKFDIYNEGDSP